MDTAISKDIITARRNKMIAIIAIAVIAIGGAVWLLRSGIKSSIDASEYIIAQERYVLGNLSITDLSIAFQENDEAKQDYVSALRDFWGAYYQLRYLSLYDFEKKQKIVQNSMEAIETDGKITIISNLAGRTLTLLIQAREFRVNIQNNCSVRFSAQKSMGRV